MNCVEFQNRLHLAVESHAEPDAALEQHGARCLAATCVEAWDDYVLLHRAIAQWQVRSSASVLPVATAPRRRVSSSKVTLRAAACLLGVLSIVALPNPFAIDEHPSQIGNAAAVGHQQEADAAALSAVPLQPEFSIDWIAGASVQMGHSMAHMLLRQENSAQESATPAQGWLKIWPEQLRPAQEDLDVLRNLLWESRDNQSRWPQDRADHLWA